MKKIQSVFPAMFIMIFMGFLLALSFVSCNECQKEDDSRVFQAYDLRMDGHADSTKVLLEQIINEDSSNALAWFELARTEMHMGLGNPRNMMDNLQNALSDIDLALKYEADNTSFLYFKGILQSLNLYIGMQMGGENIADHLQLVEDTYLDLLEIDPDYHEAKLSLVELYGFIPPDMGGDVAKAEKYALELEEADLVNGAKAREILMPEDADYITFWSDLNEENPGNADLLEAFGRIYLYEDNVEAAEMNFNKAIGVNESKKYLYLDLGRFYLMQAMQGQMPLDSAAAMITAHFNNFLDSDPAPCNPMMAWTKGQLAMIKFRTGDEEGGKILMDEASKLDSYYSRAFGTPNKTMFVPPGIESHYFQYLSRPF